MRKLILTTLALGIIALLFIGCDGNSVFTIRVSGTIGLEFSGSYLMVMSNGQSASESVNGTVPYEISVTGTNGITISRVSVELQKQTEEGTLKVEILEDNEMIGRSEITAAYGVVSITTERNVTGQIWPPAWTDFIPQLIATFVGALLGFWSAIQVNRRVQKGIEAKEDERRRQRHSLVLQLLAEEISRNRERLSNMKSDLRRITTIDYSVTLDVWRSLSREVLEAISNNRVAQTATELYDCLSLIASTLEAYNRLAAVGGREFSEARTDRLPKLENLIELSANLAAVVIQGLGAELARLQSSRSSK